jgi:hypothetical protein
VLKKKYFSLINAPQDLKIDSVIYKSASDCQLILSASAAGYPEISVTISEKAVNYWEDITSSTLAAAGVEDAHSVLPVISLFEENHRLHVRCSQPDRLPEQADIINLAGQSLMTFKLEKKTENILPHQLSPGIYLIVFRTGQLSQVLKFSITGL